MAAVHTADVRNSAAPQRKLGRDTLKKSPNNSIDLGNHRNHPQHVVGSWRSLVSGEIV